MNKNGYTLIEISVAIGIFFVVIATPAGFFVTSIRGQQKALSSQELVDNVSYGLEYMSRAMRMAKKELNCVDKTDPSTCACLKEQGYGFNYEITRGGQGIRFNNYQDSPDCQEFFLDEGRLKEVKNGGEPVPLTSDDLTVVAFKIVPDESWSQEDSKQPRVTIFLEVKSKRGQTLELQPVIKIQTTISQRNLDVTY